MSDKPMIFLGSASEQLGIVRPLEKALRDFASVWRWDLDSFRPGHFTLEELTSTTAETDFAVFILGREDETKARGETIPSPRDNVVFEAGLFTAALGRERVFYVVDVRGTKIPTDWDGLGYLTFDPDEERERDRVYEAAYRIREQVLALGRRATPVARFLGDYWQFVENIDEGAVLSLMTISASSTDPSGVELTGKSWTADGEPRARYHSLTCRLDPKDRKLFYSWEGIHPLDPGRPRYVGAGEIRFDGPRDSVLSGSGYYTSTPLSDPGHTTAKSTRYVRVTLEDRATLEQGSPEQRRELLVTRLRELKEAGF